jgi:DNA invertase Pin-like site-specific DNA recombinase
MMLHSPIECTTPYLTNQKSIRAAIYARVSTQEQTLENQLPALRDYAAARGWEVVGEFTDEASGTDQSRPGRAKLLAGAKSRG